MASGNGFPIYQFVFSPQAKKDLATLAERTKQLGLIQELKKILLHVAPLLQRKPLHWEIHFLTPKHRTAYIIKE